MFQGSSPPPEKPTNEAWIHWFINFESADVLIIPTPIFGGTRASFEEVRKAFFYFPIIIIVFISHDKWAKRGFQPTPKDEASGRPPYDPEMGHLQFAGRGLTRHSEGCSSAFWVYPESRATCQLQVLRRNERIFANIEMIVLSGMVQFHVKVVQYGCTVQLSILGIHKILPYSIHFQKQLVKFKALCPFSQKV